MVILDHIEYMVQDPTCAYAGGWNPVHLPWDGRQRAPGADGENYKRLRAVAGLGFAELPDHEDFWPFFRAADSDKSGRQLAWFHGGNMVGATSFVFVIPDMRLAVVVLCNARSFYLDGANIIGLTIADCLYRGRSETDVDSYLEKVRVLGTHSAARYMTEVGKYERILSSEYGQLATARAFGHLAGKYTLSRGIFLEVAANETDDRLELVVQGGEDRYPLRIRRDGVEVNKISMSYAMPMTTAHATGLGGKNWLNHKRYEVVFVRELGQTEGFNRLVWTFEGIDEKDREFSYLKEGLN